MVKRHDCSQNAQLMLCVSACTSMSKVLISVGALYETSRQYVHKAYQQLLHGELRCGEGAGIGGRSRCAATAAAACPAVPPDNGAAAKHTEQPLQQLVPVLCPFLCQLRWRLQIPAPCRAGEAGAR
jgi:hypothetical protein